MDKISKRKIRDDTINDDEYENNNKKKKKKSKIEKKSVNEKFNSSLNIQNNVFIKIINENKKRFESSGNNENVYRKLKANIISLNVSNVLMEHYGSFIYYEKNKIDFLLPELDNIINSSNIDLLKELCKLSFYPIYNETLSKRITEWLIKDRNQNKNIKDDNENINMSYLFSLNILLTYLIYKNDDYSNYSCLIYLNLLQWMQNDKKRLQFRLFTLKGILKRFLFCSFYFNDKEIAKIKKIDNECAINEEELEVLKCIFMSLHDSLEYMDISNLLNINDKNCIFELIKFFLDLVKRPLMHSLHILCINYLIKIVKKCYDFQFCYNINVELYDIGPHVNIFVKIVNLIFAKILSILKDIKNDENTYCIDEINNINSLIVLFFTNVINSCIRIIIPQVLFNDKLKHSYLLTNEKKNDKDGNTKDEEDFEDKVVANACNPMFSFIEIFIINNGDRHEKNMFIDLIKILVKECRKIERKYNIMKIIDDDMTMYIKGNDNKKKQDNLVDKNYVKIRKISKKRIDSSASFNLSDEYSSSVYSETEGEDFNDSDSNDADSNDADSNGADGSDADGNDADGNDADGNHTDGNDAYNGGSKDNEKDIGKGIKDNESANEECQEEAEKGKEKEEGERHEKAKKERKKKVVLNQIKNKRKSAIIVDNKKYIITYESVMVRYLNILLKYFNCEKYQIRNIILDLFLALIKKKKTSKNEYIFQNLFKLFLERLEDPNMIVKAKALSILVILTNRKYHNNILVYKFIFNKTREKINMYKIISSNIYSHRSNIRKLTIQYIEAIFETLISRKLSYKIFLIFISNYLYSLSLDAMSSVRRQVLLTVNNLFIIASEDIYIAKIWLSIIFSAITDIEETIKDEAISIFLNTFIKSSFQCTIFNTSEKKIKQILEKNKLSYFKIDTHADGNTDGLPSPNVVYEFEENENMHKIINSSFHDNVKNRGKCIHEQDEFVEGNQPFVRTFRPSVHRTTQHSTSNKMSNNSFTKNIAVEIKGKIKSEKKEKEEYDKNNDGVLLLINIWKRYIDKDLNNLFLTILKVMTKYDLLYFNMIIFCLKKKKNNMLDHFIHILNTFVYNMRYFSIRMCNTFILDFIIQLSKHYQNKINIDHILFLLNRCYKIYLMSINEVGNYTEIGEASPSNNDKSNNKNASRGDDYNGKKNEMKTHVEETNIVNQRKREAHKENELAINMVPSEQTDMDLVSDEILRKEDLMYEMNVCSMGVIKNIMLKLFTILYNLLDNINELNEDFLQKLEYTIFHFNCPLCFIYIILNILIKKKKNVNDFIDKLKGKIIFFFNNIETLPYNTVFCNVLVTFIFLIDHFRKSDSSFLATACHKLRRVYDNTANDGISERSVGNVAVGVDSVDKGTGSARERRNDCGSGDCSEEFFEDRCNIMVKNCIYLTLSVLLIDKGVPIRNELFSNFERDLKNSNTSMSILNNLIILTYYMVINFGSSCNKFVFILLRFFKHENSFIRYLSFYMLSKLISEDYVKFNNQFFFGFLYLLADKNEVIRKQSLSVYKHILLMYNKTNLINHIIEFIFVLNNFFNFKLSKHLSNIGNSFEIKNEQDRHMIYSLILENLKNSEKFSLQQKLINEYLIQYVYNYDNYYFSEDNLNEKRNNKRSVIPLNNEDNESAVLLDVLNILSSKLMKIKIKKDFAKLEEKNKNMKIKNVENSVKVLNDLMKNILKKNTLPILLSLRSIMLKDKSFFFKYMNDLIIYLCLDFKDSLDDLIPDIHVKNEIQNDCQNFVHVDAIHLHTEQADIFNKSSTSSSGGSNRRGNISNNNSSANVHINFFELSLNQMTEQREERHREELLEKKREKEKQKGKRTDLYYLHDNSSSDYDEVTDVLHGIHNGEENTSKKKKKRK
ncbi:condensin-2 complex subunit D3, putative [Plasmodium malariae]|uniref:Condensin-2 complex subunit D3, putative n=1 Tax=Plasmodium malariae TaxID=5858 RepID=A0A1D3PC62_PLAMA|nr:condensin-2 complex subunit D3, putative [Plasmodium malariae]SCN12874.1 condensin-2 complex subunit D3, putative [Plasmodium malariae]